jgi:hypothetical protein
MIQEEYNNYKIKSYPTETGSGKWAVCAVIERNYDGNKKTKSFYADDKIYYILEIEAAKEGLNLGKNLINRSLVGF